MTGVLKLHTVSFGCQMNAADSEEMGRTLGERGFGFTQNLEDADAILINTCTVRQHAEDKAFSYVGTLRQWKEKDPNRLLIIAGCAAERTKETLQKRFPHVDLVVGAKSIEQFPEIIKEAISEKFKWNEDFNEIALPEARNAQGVSAYVTIMRGCNYTCTYCIVPFVRGREVYRPIGAILSEIRERVSEGAKEIVLLGQTVNSYHYANGRIYDFADLLTEAGAVCGAQRLRFMSPHPHYVNDKLIETMARTPAVCEHLHLPLQSGSNKILKLMRRNYTRERYGEIIAQLRSAIPGISITTDIIVGFPSETEADFQESLSMIQEIEFDGAYCFKFSPRQGTEAALMDDQLSDGVKEERLARLLKLTENLGRAKAAAQAGRSAQVLWETHEEGRSRENWRVRVKSEAQNLPGTTTTVQIESAQNRLLLARL